MTQRASVHTDTLKKKEQLFKNYGDRSVFDSIAKEVTDITKLILDDMMRSKKFKTYLKSIFETLGQYAGNVFRKLNHLGTFSCFIVQLITYTFYP